MANAHIMKLAIAPHNDDLELFMCYTAIREKPLILVCTDSFIQPKRGDIGCTAEIRRAESMAAAKIINCPVVFLGIKDTELTEDILRERLRDFSEYEKVWIPAVQGGNPQHDIVGKVGRERFPNALSYTTYTKSELYTTGTTEVVPTHEEVDLKLKALACYQSQLNLGATRPHFLAVLGKSEWLNQ